ncbi:MAG TPA: hypothetical protein ENN79_10975 [Desulfobacteraceae bacterium]|nr:hypothetical protein [Desulfobacteraceae bacterium]
MKLGKNISRLHHVDEGHGRQKLSSGNNKRIAIPEFMGRVAPVLDACTRLLIIDSESRRLVVECSCMNDRLELFSNFGVQVVICGALSTFLSDFLEEKKIHLLYGISGDIEEVLQAYRQGYLHRDHFCMPGFLDTPH